MATLLFWLSWRSAEPDSASWAEMRARAQGRSRFPGIELCGDGFRLFAARTRAAEPAVVLEQLAEDGSQEILLLDRAVGADDATERESGFGPDERLLDGTPTAAVRWNKDSRVLRLYRDLMGQRALVYARVNGGVIVASGEDVLRAHPEISGDLDPLYLATYFAVLPPAPDQTVFADIRCLASGEVLEFDAAGKQRSSVTTLEPDESWRSLDDAGVVERFRELFHTSVRNACLGARRVGISLSAGMDSSSIAAVASRLPQTLTGGIVGVTHTLPDFPDIDEHAMVASLAQALGIEFRPVAVDHLLPFADAELRPICPDTPQQSLYREWYERGYQEFSAAGVDVWLSGAFGDHLFAGSVEWVVDAARFRRLGLLARQLVGEFGRKGWRGMLRDTALRRPASRLLGRVATHSDRVEWLDPSVRDDVCARLDAEYERFQRFPRPAQCVLTLGATAAFSANSEHWYAQRHQMESRLPFRDVALMRFCLSLPADFSYRDGRQKWLAREAMRDYLPESVRQRPKGSLLTPVYQRATERQSEVLRSLRDRLHRMPAGYFGRLQALRVSEDAVEVVLFLQAALAAWETLDSQRTGRVS